jgi:hypothetical protein
MKTLIIIIAFALGLFYQSNTQAQENVHVSSILTDSKLVNEVAKKQTFPKVTVGLAGGIGFPIAGFSDQFKQGGTGAVDIGLRLNNEVGIFINGKYSNLPAQVIGASTDNLVEISAGPRYYFSTSRLKSMFFMEAGLGAYILNKGSYTTPGGVVIDKNTTTNLGANIGPGFSLWLSDKVDIMLKGKYHVIFTNGSTTNFATSLLGLEYKF